MKTELYSANILEYYCTKICNSNNDIFVNPILVQTEGVIYFVEL